MTGSFPLPSTDNFHYQPTTSLSRSSTAAEAPARSQATPKLPSIATMLGELAVPPRSQSSFSPTPYSSFGISVRTPTSESRSSFMTSDDRAMSRPSLTSPMAGLSMSPLAIRGKLQRPQTSFGYKSSRQFGSTTSQVESASSAAEYSVSSNRVAPPLAPPGPASGTGGYECDKCGHRYARSVDLINHVKVHDESRPFACKYCELRFSRKFDQQRHERSIHTGEKPFKCPTCNAEYARSDALTRHLRLEGACRSEGTASSSAEAPSGAEEGRRPSMTKRPSSFDMPGFSQLPTNPTGNPAVTEDRSGSPLSFLQSNRIRTPSPPTHNPSPLKPNKLSFMLNTSPATSSGSAGGSSSRRRRSSSFSFI